MAGEQMLVHRLQTGVVRTRRARRGPRRYVGRDWSPEAHPVNAYLIEHPDGLCLFDTGQCAAASAPGYLPRWHPFLRLARFELTDDDEVVARLARAGVAPRDVRWVVLSHLHTDHMGGVGAFPHSEVIVSDGEWARARGLAGALRGYLPRRWPRSVTPRLVSPGGPAIGPFPASLDLAGDGGLVVVPTPGHTAGHLALLARGARIRVLLGGDVVHPGQTLAEAAPEIARFCAREEVAYLGAHDSLETVRMGDDELA